MISKAELKDAEAIANLVNSAYRGDYAKKGWTTEAGFIEGTRTHTTLVEDLLNTPGVTILKYVRDAQLISVVELKKDNERLYLGMLTVDPSLQSGGIGKEMIKASEDFGRKQGCKSIFMRVITRRSELIAWYERQGYADNGQREPFKVSDPRNGNATEPLEFLQMEKQL